MWFNKIIIIATGLSIEQSDIATYNASFNIDIMSYEIAKAFAEVGAKVILISGSSSITPPDGLHQFISITSPQEIYNQVMTYVVNAVVFISDTIHADKIKKIPDILAAVSRLEKRPLTIGLSAETGDLLSSTRGKLFQKNADMIFAQKIEIETYFENVIAQTLLIKKDGSAHDFGKKSKEEHVQLLLAHIEELESQREFFYVDRCITLQRDIISHRENLLTLNNRVIHAIGNCVEKTNIEKQQYLIREQENQFINIYIYNSKSSIYQCSKKPTLFYLSGTGWVGRNIDIEHLICSRLACETGAQIILPEYRLSPEHKAPIPFQDCYDALFFIAENFERFSIDMDRLFLGGYSCGGGMAVSLSVMAKYDGINIKKMFLMSPGLDLSRSIKAFQAEQNQDGIIKELFLEWRRDKYVPKGIAFNDPLISPYFLSKELLSELPPTTLFFGVNDIVRGDSESFSEKLLACGVNVEKCIFDGEHCSFWYNAEPIKLMCTAIRKSITNGESFFQANRIVTRYSANIVNRYFYTTI